MFRKGSQCPNTPSWGIEPQPPSTLLFEGAQNGQGRYPGPRSHFSADPSHAPPVHSSQKTQAGHKPSPAQASLSPTGPGQPAHKRTNACQAAASTAVQLVFPFSETHFNSFPTTALTLKGSYSPTRVPEPLSPLSPEWTCPPSPPRLLGPHLLCNFRARRGLPAPRSAVQPPGTPSWVEVPVEEASGLAPWAPGGFHSPQSIPLPTTINSAGASPSGQAGLTPRGGAWAAGPPAQAAGHPIPRPSARQALHFRPVMRPAAVRKAGRLRGRRSLGPRDTLGAASPGPEPRPLSPAPRALGAIRARACAAGPPGPW